MEGQFATIHTLSALSDEKQRTLVEETRKDPVCQYLLSYIYGGWPASHRKVPKDVVPYWSYQEELHEAGGLIYRGSRLVIPVSMRQEVVRQLHQAHQGITACLLKARLHVFWPGLTQDVTQFIKRCHTCRSRDPNNPRTIIQPHQIPSLPWEVVGTDLCQVKNSKLIILVDYFSKFIEAQELSVTTADAVIKFLTPHFARHGAPQKLVSDNGPPFSSFKFQEFLRNWGVRHVTSSPFFPRSNGMAERCVQTVKNLVCKARNEGRDLQYILMEYRTTPVGNLPTPTQMLMGRHIRTPSTTTTATLYPQYPIHHIREQLGKRQQTMIQKQQVRRPLRPVGFHVGDWVYYYHGHRDWRMAQVQALASEPHSYVIKTQDGRVFRRTRAHLRPCLIKSPGDEVAAPGAEMRRAGAQPRQTSYQEPASAHNVVRRIQSRAVLHTTPTTTTMTPKPSEKLVQFQPSNTHPRSDGQDASLPLVHDIPPSPFPSICPPFSNVNPERTLTTRSGRITRKPQKYVT